MKGHVFWVTGLAGAGKTTISKLLVKTLKEKKLPVIFLDGDTLRAIFGKTQSHSLGDRMNLAMQYARLSQELSSQGFIVVCATISMFHKVRNWNRENIVGYHEIYLKVDKDILIERDQKQLYSRVLRGEINNIMGMDLDFEEPECPDLTICNWGIETSEVIDRILKTFSL